MVARGHEVAVITTDRSDKLPVAESSERLEVVRVRAYPSARDYYVAPSLRRFVLHEQPDIVHVQSFHTAVAPLTLSLLARLDVPYLLSFHSGGSSRAWRRSIRPLQYRLLRRYVGGAKALLAVSEFERQLFVDRLEIDPSRIQVIPNGVSTQIVDQRGVVERDPNLMVSAGRIERYKGHHRAIEAMPDVLRAVPEARLLVVGSGPYQDELERLIRTLGVTDAVDLTSVSQHDRAGMGRLLAEATVSIALSDYEAEGIGVIESRAMGCRVIVTAGTALRELIDSTAVVGVPPDPPKPVVAAAMIDALRAGAPEPPALVRTWDAVTDDLEALYHRILA